ncbi:MAG: rod-binding protein [Gammaproteobacteria bacterium]|nr:rod-binding protein [Gammaproteobacteria bacterium]
MSSISATSFDANTLSSSSNVPTDQERTAEVAQEFEALLVFTMIKSMRTSLSEDTLTGSSQQNLYREMLDREIAESIARRGDLGLKQMFEQQLSKPGEGPTDVALLPDSAQQPSAGTRPKTDLGIGVMESIARQKLLSD